MPDEALLDAGSRRTRYRRGLEVAAQEMLNDERSVGMRQDLSSQWFIQDQTRYADPEYSLFPDFDEELRAAMLQETELFFEEIWREDASLLDLVDAQFTFRMSASQPLRNRGH